MREIELLRNLVSGILPGKGCQQIALLSKLLFKGRQQFFCLGESRVLGQYIGLSRLAETELALKDIKQVTLHRDDALGRGDLSAQRRFLDRRRNHIAGQRQIGRLELEQLLFGRGIQILDGAEVGAPDIRYERYRQLVGRERELGLRFRYWNGWHL